MALIRARWAALGAAVAVSIGAGGGIGLVNATVNSGERTVLVPITACRIADTRPASQVGPKASPVGPNETHTVSAHGTNGDCILPTDAVALSLNVTALNATSRSFVTIWANGTTRPLASSLNPAPGQPPTPNAVVTELSADGNFDVFNEAGSIDVIIDVNGYYADHGHDDLYYTKNQTQDLIDEHDHDDRYFTQDLADDRYYTKNQTQDLVDDAQPKARGYVNSFFPTDIRFSDNVASIVENAAAKQYEITLSEGSVGFSHVASLTLRGSSCPSGTDIRSDSVSGKLIVLVLEPDGSFADNCSFSFVLFD